MDEDLQDGLLTVWQMFNAATTALFKNLDHGIEGLESLLMSVLKSARESSEVLVPRQGISKCPEIYYKAFNKWLFGRMFYILHIEKLNRIHDLSKEAQYKVLYILYVNEANFFGELVNEYLTIFDTLFSHYLDTAESNCAHQLELIHFTPDETTVPDTDLDLQPVYVVIEDVCQCRHLISCTLEILRYVIGFHCFNDVHNCYESLFNRVLDMMEYSDVSLTLYCLEFFTSLLHNPNTFSVERFCENYPLVVDKLLQNIEALVSILPNFLEEIQSDVIQKFNQSIGIILNDTSQYLKQSNKTATFTNICMIILNEILSDQSHQINKTKCIFDKKIKNICLLHLKGLSIPINYIKLKCLQAEDIEMISPFYKDFLFNTAISKQVTLTNRKVKTFYLTDIQEAINSLDATTDTKIDSFAVKIHLEKCLSVTNIMQYVQIKYSIWIKKSHACKKKHSSNDQLFSNETITNMINSLENIFKIHVIKFLNDYKLYEIYLEIIIGMAFLIRQSDVNNAQKAYSLIIHRSSTDISQINQAFEKNLPLQCALLTNLLTFNLIFPTLTKEDWKERVTQLLKMCSRMRSNEFFKKIVKLLPLIIINKILTPSKVISEFLHPALSTSNQSVQDVLIETLPTILCLSFGSCLLYKHNGDEPSSTNTYVISKSKVATLALMCTKCHKENCIEDESFISEIRSREFVLWQSESTIRSNDAGLKCIFENFLNMKMYAVGMDRMTLNSLTTSFSQHGIWTDLSRAQLLTHVTVRNNGSLMQIFVRNVLQDISMEDGLRDTIFQSCIDSLVQATKKSLETNSFDLQRVTLDCIKQVGFVQNDQVILPCTKLLVYFIMHPRCTLSPTAVVYLRDICEAHGSHPNKIYHRYKKDYCRLFVDCSLYSGKRFAASLLKVVCAFGFVGYRDFISKDVHHFLPYLLPYAVKIETVQSIIEELASLVQCSPADFMCERLPHVYTHVRLYESEAVATKCFQLVEQITNCTILSLVKRHFRVILIEFLLQYCCGPEKVLTACKWLALHDPDYPVAVTKNANWNVSQIADFIHPRFLGVLAYFDNKILNEKVALSVKQKALQSFPDILKMMGSKYLTPLRFKVLATLHSALTLAKEFPKILACAWSAFIHNIDAGTLGPLLTTITVSLLQQHPYAPVEVNKIFQYLVGSNENILSAHIPDLFFLNDSDVCQSVKTIIRKHVRKTQPTDFLERLKWYLHHLNQDISDVRAYALQCLDKELKAHRRDINNAIFGGKVISPVLVELLDCLMSTCGGARSSSVRLLATRCLGQLGAIEPGHLPRRYAARDKAPLAFHITDDCFAQAALAELTRAFQSEKDTKNMDSYALTIQEVLKNYGISPTGAKKEMWDSFPEQMHQIMLPLLSSRYTLALATNPKKTHPLFGSGYASTVTEWASYWTGQLIPQISTAGIAPVRELLRMAHPSMRRDARTLRLFLPYVVLHAVMAEENHQYVREEIMAVIGLETFEHQKGVMQESKYQMLRDTLMMPAISSSTAEEGTQTKCCKMVYVLLDFLNRWILEWCHTKNNPLEDKTYKCVNRFVESLCKRTVARGSFLCGEFERALQYLERYAEAAPHTLQEELPFLAQIYAVLDEPDAVAGILSIKRCEPSLSELILAHEVTGRLQDAATCYERLAQERNLHAQGLQGMVECYLSLDQPFTAYRLLLDHGGHEDELSELAAEPMWRLGMWEQLDDLVKKPASSCGTGWGVTAGRILLELRSGDRKEFSSAAQAARERLLRQLEEARGAGGGGDAALRRGYAPVLATHALVEMEHAEELLHGLKKLSDGSEVGSLLLAEVVEEWRLRLLLVQGSVRAVEPVLRMRRVLLEQTQELLSPTHPHTASAFQLHIGNLWLQSAKLARKAGTFQQAYIYILNAEKYRPARLFIEKAKLYRARGQHDAAFATLKRGLEEHFPDLSVLDTDQRKICAKAKLLIALYNDETTSVDVDLNISHYKEAVEVYSEWEKSLVCLAVYYEKSCVPRSAEGESVGAVWTRKVHALNCYGRALQHGHRHLYQSMPRMLSIWLDFEVTPSDPGCMATLAEMSQIIKAYSQKLPLHLFLTAFSQIVSRICHPVKEVYMQLKGIIVQLILAYPQHTLWMLLSVMKSGYPQRMRRCQDVLSDPRLREPMVLKLVHDFTQLAEKLIELCNKPIPDKSPTTTVSSLVRTLPRLLAAENFSHIMMPWEHYCKVVLPGKAAGVSHLAAEPPVYIAGILDQVTILPSLQRPRKVTLIGSDGKSYIIMLKPKDDLRKDFRLMEFNGVVNRFLQDEAEARSRRLYIRTYAVLPLNEECGLIQWVPHLLGYRPILLQIYDKKGLHTSNRFLKELMCSNKDPLSKKRSVFLDKLLPRFPPVFAEWFRRTFADPYGWYQARSAYIRTVAVMSMVGYILGIGDRHGENILFDSTNGDAVHVDFNCLFNKGETFEWPERVPFRLTHNMEAAMGPLGREGMYRKSCEVTMRTLRSQTATLMSVIRPFVYDPLVSWQRPGRSVVDMCPGGERTNNLAKDHLREIEQRLQGMVRTRNKQMSLSLSAEGQVDHLIQEATSIDNLCQMYIGWGPFL